MSRLQCVFSFAYNANTHNMGTHTHVVNLTFQGWQGLPALVPTTSSQVVSGISEVSIKLAEIVSEGTC